MTHPPQTANVKAQGLFGESCNSCSNVIFFRLSVNGVTNTMDIDPGDGEGVFRSFFHLNNTVLIVTDNIITDIIISDIMMTITINQGEI